MSENINDIPATEANNQTSSYRSIFKATSLFGGVQVFHILINIISSKFVAVLLGPLGMGIKGLLQSSIFMIEGFTSMGISRSAVRDVSMANGTGNQYVIGRTVAALKRLVWVTGLLGMIVTIVLSPLLSKLSFGNYDYTLPFVFLSIILLFNQLSAGQLVLLQGLRRLKYLAKASAIGATLGLIVSVPLYYLLGVKGIVPTLILTSVSSLALSFYFSKKVEVQKVRISNKEALQEGRLMLRMGIAMSVSSLLTLVFSYLLRGFIRYQGDIEAVGIFTAGFAIINTYVGMIFDAMIKDFYPRLSAISSDNVKCSQVVNQQAEVGILIMAPMLIACLVFMPIVIWILYSDKFMGAMDYIVWAIPGMLFKLASWTVALIFTAKGNPKLYMSNEVFGSILNFICSITGYYLWGLKGLGLGFTTGYLLYLLKVYITAHNQFEFSFTISFLKLFGIQFMLVGICLVMEIVFKSWFLYVLGSIVFIVSGYISLKGMNDRTNFMQVIKKRIGNE